jgi:murein DD-endopeptidase MepM/ murein hydrolase activator NlpD
MITLKNNHDNGPTGPAAQEQTVRLYSPCGDREKGTFRVTSRYGWRKNPVTGKQMQFHNGLDLRTHNCPTSGGKGLVFPCEAGIITRILGADPLHPSRFLQDGTQAPIIDGVQRGWTPFVEIRGETTGWLYVYRHVQHARGHAVGRRVGLNQAVGDTAKNYGYSTAAHLHLEIWSADRKKTFDPLLTLEAAGLREVQRY